jgi:hypothetical protein
MRVGRPIPLPPQPCCDYCGERARLLHAGDDGYPYLENHGPLWVCLGCQAWIGVRPRSKQNPPLGRLADAALRDAKSRLHDALEPLVAAKMRRDGVNPFEARGKAMKWVIATAGLEASSPSIHVLSLEQCEQAIRCIDDFRAARAAKQHPDAE